MLQSLFEEPYLNAGIDKFIWMLPTRYLDPQLWDHVVGLATETGEMGSRFFSSMHKLIQPLSIEGLNFMRRSASPAYNRCCCRQKTGSLLIPSYSNLF